jgi:hypothetical protein
MNSRQPRALFALASVAAFLFAITLAAAPGLHSHFHADAAHAQHECAVTILGSGKIEIGGAAAAVPVPSGSCCVASVTPLHPEWVQPLFLSSSVFEHAPPALS